MEKYNWLNEDSRKFLANGYLQAGQTAEHRIQDIAAHAVKLSGNPLLGERFLYHMSKGHFSLSSPVWSNYGTTRGLPVSCFGGYVEDSVEGILYAHAEQGMLTKLGGGTSLYFGDVRCRGSEITNNGTSHGVVPFIRMMDTMTDVISQGSTRRGYMATYLPIYHKDIDEFLDIGSDGNDIQGIMTGVTVPDDWLSSMEEGDKAKRKIWAKVLKRRSEQGYPYIVFSDAVNNGKPDIYKELNMEVQASNLCVTGDTKILTKDGYKEISTLAGQYVECWNGKEWSNTAIAKTSEAANVLKVITSDHTTLEATPEHKWYVVTDYRGGVVEKRTKELELGDKLIKFDLEPVTHGTRVLNYAYENGFHSGDGTVYKNNGKVRISLHDEKQTLLHRFSGYYSTSLTKEGRILNLHYRKGVLADKFVVPSTDYAVSSRVAWLSGYLDADGTLTSNAGAQSLQVASIEKGFLVRVKLLLQELGVHSNLSLMRKACYVKLPANDGSGALKEYWTKDIYRLGIAGAGIAQLVALGLSTERLKQTDHAYNRDARTFVKIVDVIDEGKTVPTYCGNEPKEHKLVFNGILTGNCSEIALPSNIDESFTCVLSSLNLLHYDSWKDSDAVEVLVSFLDTVVTEFINRAKDMPVLERAVSFAENHRALGMGVLGWHSYLMSKNMPFESREAATLNLEVFKTIKRQAYAASKNLGSMYGTVLGTDRRNTTLMAIAPTKSSSFILGQVSQGIEPIMSNYFVNNTAKVVSVYKNPYLKELLQTLGMDTPEVWKSIEQEDGSVQHLDIPDTAKQVYKTFAEISPEAIIDQAAVRQTYVDQSQSVNLMVSPLSSTKELNGLYMRAWKTGVKSLYYQFTLSAAQVKARELSAGGCTVCEG